jgi:uncharacterized protein (DUF1800 family)
MSAPADSAALRRALDRVTYGASPALVEEAQRLGWTDWIHQQLAPDDSQDADFNRRFSSFKLLIDYEIDPAADGKAMMMKGGKQHVKEMRPLKYLDLPVEKVFPMCRDDKMPYGEKERPLHELTIATILRAVFSRWQVREMIVGFWHDHFNIDAEKDDTILVSIPSFDRDAIRRNALGNFRQLLESVARSTAMLYYLDGVGSRASPANENFARELFELHTLGARHYFNHLYTKWRDVPGALDGKPSGYIDQDVYEAARCFTGWTVENGDEDDGGVKRPLTGKFLVHDAWHDPYQKRVLGTEFDSQRPALEDGCRVLDLVAAHPATARFIAEKLCRRFLCDSPPESLITKAQETFTAQRDAPDQIAQTLRTIFLAPEFVDAPKSKLKRPLEYLASLVRCGGMEFTPTSDVNWALESMGQRLFRWHTPAGHPDTAPYWTGGTFLLRRWNFARTVAFDDDWKKITGCRYLSLTPPDCRTIGAVLDYWHRRLTGEAVPDTVRDALLKTLSRDSGKDPDEEFRGGDRERTERLSACCALIAASPAFQLR